MIVLNTAECVFNVHMCTYHEIIIIYLETNTAHTRGSVTIYLGINSVLQAKVEKIQGIGSFHW